MMSSDDYVKRGGLACPYCESTDVETSGMMDCDVGVAWQSIVCNDCDEEWTDQYSLTGFAPVE